MLEGNNTPLAALGFEQWHSNGATMGVITARARVRVEPDGYQFLEKLPEVILADEFAGDPHASDMLYSNDLIPYKPYADLTIAGAICSVEPQRSLNATVRIGDRMVHLRACGPRHWYHDGNWRLSQPEPLNSVPLSWTLAAGGRVIGDPDGAVDARNPIGPGVLHEDYTPRTLEIKAPQIDSIAAPIGKTHFQATEPQGLGLIPQWWASRSAFVGTYDEDWKKNVHPRLPADFDYRHYQVAPPILQLNHYLEPGMAVELDGLRLRPEAPTLIVIPDLVPFATYRYNDGRSIMVRLNLDGWHLDASDDTIRYDLTWRAWVEMCPRLTSIDLDIDRTAALKSHKLLRSIENGVALA